MRTLTIEEAEKLHGARLDRRRRYATTDDGTQCDLTGSHVFEVARWSQACSGCHPGAYLLDGRGNGCSECGYTGRSRRAQWVPVSKPPNVAYPTNPSDKPAPTTGDGAHAPTVE